MKIKRIIIVLCAIIVLMVPTTALAQESSSTYQEITWVTEIAGKDTADRIAQNWSYNAELILIWNSKGALWQKNRTFRVVTTEWAYMYRSDDKYLRVRVDVNNTARSEELSKEEVGEQDKVSPLVDWRVDSQYALGIVFKDYGIDFERGDDIGTFRLYMEEVYGTTPVWHISIIDGITRMPTLYRIDALTGEILTPPKKERNPIIIGGIIAGICTIIAAIIGLIGRRRGARR